MCEYVRIFVAIHFCALTSLTAEINHYHLNDFLIVTHFHM